MLIIPAILEEDIKDARKQIDRLRGVVPWIQIDFMDGTMTENKTFDLNDLTKDDLEGFEVEFHLMSSEPEKYFDVCNSLDASRIYFHVGVVSSPGFVLEEMDKYQFSRGMALCPKIEVDMVFSYIDDIDAVQVMTVVPGKQGGKFLPDMLTKISDIRERRNEIWIGVDGGINKNTIKDVARFNPDAVGVGSAISNSNNVSETVFELATAIEETLY